MYSYTYDAITGGILLNSSPSGFSKEPRPVYAPELDLLGFDAYWTYDKQRNVPYMWAEANSYYYRGKLVAKLKGGDIFNVPEIIIPEDESGKPVTPESEGVSLRPIDIANMVKANTEMIEIIEQTTVKKILEVYDKYKNKLDCFHVAFSGGKDSCVLLDLVKKALPKRSFVVVFGDTGMEFPDTYDIIEKTQAQCEEEEIPFYIAKSHLEPEQSWKVFGPPARVLRWCCSVHKSTPQTLKLREVTGKSDYTGLAYVGIRAQESAARAEYDYMNDGKKIKGQYSYNSILEWTSSEVWLYIYANNLLLNEAYKKGSARVGCLCCPMGGGKAGFIEYTNYASDVGEYLNIINDLNGRKTANVEELIKSGGWSARKNGRDIKDNSSHCDEQIKNGSLIIDITNPSSDWQEWIKTINIDTCIYEFIKTRHGYTVILPEKYMKQNPLFGKLFRQVFRKAAYCKNCKVCEANCISGALKFVNGNININNCIRCQKCHDIDSGCLLFHSLRLPQGEGKPMASLNSLSNHAPKTEWFTSFYENGNGFFAEHHLGPDQIGAFKKLLKNAGLIDAKNQITPFFNLIKAKGWDTDVSLGLVWINLITDNAQFEWYIKNFDIGRFYPRKQVMDMLKACDVKEGGAQSICNAYKRLTETPFGTVLRFGYVSDEGDLVRTACTLSDPRVFLYGLFKFAEKCHNFKEFTLETLLNDSIERDGISPTRILGLGREEATPLLLGLSTKYPEFITASFTHDLDKITLAGDKTANDVLGLF
ncbi:hypothetical protein FACS1894142_5470 [Spirochaetia bacterium]|nr:hypothetical protein FACS1894142_5440 [Spirochaetia bacterium]GHT98742.1 hypothetical protein FACS1894142_5470 [Spirochaetia bacterium]